MARTYTHLERDGGEGPPYVTAALNPPAGAAVVLLMGITGEGITPANIGTPSGCKPTWTERTSFQLGDWAYKVFVGTGATTNESISTNATGSLFAAEWNVDQIAADGVLSFPSANVASATGSSTTPSVTLPEAFQSAASGVYSVGAFEDAEGITPGTGYTEIADGFAIGHSLFSQRREDNDSSVDCSQAGGGVFGLAAFEVVETIATDGGSSRRLGGVTGARSHGVGSSGVNVF